MYRLPTRQWAQARSAGTEGGVVEAPCERCYATVILLLGQRLDWSAARELFDGMVAAGVPRGEYAYG